jgi:hypothetical protein
MITSRLGCREVCVPQFYSKTNQKSVPYNDTFYQTLPACLPLFLIEEIIMMERVERESSSCVLMHKPHANETKRDNSLQRLDCLSLFLRFSSFNPHIRSLNHKIHPYIVKETLQHHNCHVILVCKG